MMQGIITAHFLFRLVDANIKNVFFVIFSALLLLLFLLLYLFDY